MKTLISLFDYTGAMVKPWADAGHLVLIVDSQHPRGLSKDGNIFKLGFDLSQDLNLLIPSLGGIRDVDIIFSFTPCTDMAVSGAAHFKSKLLTNPNMWREALFLAKQCPTLAKHFGSEYMVENPVSKLATLWRKPDHYFHPYEYGGYLAANDKHPKWDIIPGRDAYPKKTCLWVSPGFIMPTKKPVPISSGYSSMYSKLGGKSLRTKNIRSATPRGFAEAVYQAN